MALKKKNVIPAKPTVSAMSDSGPEHGQHKSAIPSDFSLINLGWAAGDLKKKKSFQVILMYNKD